MKPQTITDFSWIKLNPSQYMKRAQAGLKSRKRVIETVKAIPKIKRTFENTVLALETGSQDLELAANYIGFLMNVKPDKKTRQIAKEVLDYIQIASIEMEFDVGIFQALKEFEDKKPKLIGPDKKLFTEMMRDYRRMGFDLPKAKRDLVKKYTKQLAKLGSDFSKNINDYENYILVTKDELAGLPQSYISSLQKSRHKFKVGLSYPEYIPFMENAKSEVKRAELSKKYLKKGGKKNMVLLKNMVEVRDKTAKLLGYKNHAHYVLEVKMAKNPSTVGKFLQSLVNPLRAKVKVDIVQLQKVKQQLSGNPEAKLEHHDILYTINQDLKKRFNVDEQVVRQYFPMKIVTEGMFQIYETLFGVKFKELSGLPVYHKDVKAFSVNEKRTGELLAYFYLDLFPRAGKYGHAAVFPIIPGYELPNGEYNKPLVAMVANFNKPSKKTPSLLSHDEVNTYFHEFGHVVHGVLTKAKYSSQSGTSVQRDFVEAPSQMLENWVWDEKMLALLSGHYKNPKKKLPKKLLKDMLSAKYHMVAYFSMRQLTLGMFDYILHTENSLKDIAKIYSKLVKDFFGLNLPKDQMFPAGFGHMDGYDAGYYGYMWSNVFATDMFTRFKKQGLLNPKTGSDYRKYILEPGSSREALELVTKFLGRKPNNKAFLKEIGVE